MNTPIHPISPRVNVILGNEAADADSIISSLTFAYLQCAEDEKHRQLQCESNNNDKGHGSDTKFDIFDCYLPIVCVERKELYLRKDVEILLQSVELELSDLVCLDECPWSQLYSKNCLSFTLTDHNVIAPKVLDRLGLNEQSNQPIGNDDVNSLVKEIIDHHIDSGEYPECKGPRRLIAFDAVSKSALVGSTCTLVAEKFSSSPNLDATISTLLMGVIGLDTMNMDPKIAKGTARDRVVYEDLQRRAKDIIKDPTAFYNTLVNAKTDISYWRQLLPADALRLDYKRFEKNKGTTSEAVASSTGTDIHPFGMSSVLLPVYELLNNEGFADSALEIINQQGLDYLAIMSLVNQPDPQREIAIVSESPEVLKGVCTTLLGGEPSLSLSAGEHPASQTLLQRGLYIQWYNQGNIKASRKQVAPILQA